MIDDKKIIALCTTRINDIDIHSFIRTLYEETCSKNFRIMVFTLNADIYWVEDVYHSEASVFDAIPYDHIDVLILMDERIKSRNVALDIVPKAKEHDVPVLTIDGEYEGTTTVKYDYELGFEKMVRHVIEEHNVRRPHLMAGERWNRFSDERINVFKRLCGEYDISWDDSMYSHGDFWAVPARAATKELLKRDELPEAIICANDIMAINVSDVLQQNGVSVPDDVIVTGFDGIAETDFSVPKISTVKCDSILMAKTIAGICIKGEYDKLDKVYRVEPELDIKESCGCKCHKKTNFSYVAKMNDSFYRYTDDVRGMHAFTTRLQLCKSFDKVAEELYDIVTNNTYLLHSLTCVLYGYCFEKNRNIFLDPDAKYDITQKRVICDFLADHGYVKELPEDVVLPHLRELLEDGHPLIFNALDNMDKPLGYVCYRFDSFNIIDYSKTASISNSIAMGLSGFINMQHQHYLADKVDEMYRYDSLTGLYNRSGFLMAFENIKEDRVDEQLPVTVIMADLDDLKAINDNYGHDAGDKAIATVARALKDSCPTGSLCMRYGGDEMFALLLGECDVDEIMNHIQELLRVFNTIAGYAYEVNVSCGAYSSVLSDDLSFDDMVKGADQQMYMVKKEKKRRNVN